MSEIISNDTQALEYIKGMANTHEGLYFRDLDALLELGEADMDTIFGGYLWAEIERDFGIMDEDTEELLVCAISDFYIDAVSCAQDIDRLYEEV